MNGDKLLTRVKQNHFDWLPCKTTCYKFQSSQQCYKVLSICLVTSSNQSADYLSDAIMERKLSPGLTLDYVV